MHEPRPLMLAGQVLTVAAAVCLVGALLAELTGDGDRGDAVWVLGTLTVALLASGLLVMAEDRRG